MYTISKQFNFSAIHVLEGLPDGHPCGRLHGHNYVAEIVLAAESLSPVGFVVDYNELSQFKDIINNELDHRHLNDVLAFPSTAEHIARYLYERAKPIWPEVVAVRIRETPKTCAEYRP